MRQPAPHHELVATTEPAQCGRQVAGLLFLAVVSGGEFGSRAAGVGHADSDGDLAIYTTDDYEWDDLFALRGTLTGLLHTERLDLVWLNHAKAGLAFR